MAPAAHRPLIDLLKSALTIASAKLIFKIQRKDRPVRSLIVLLSMLLCVSPLFAQTAPSGPKDIIKSEEVQQYLRVAQRMSAKGDLRGAIGFYQQVLAAQPANSEALAGMADILVAAGNPLEATPYYQKLQSLNPGDLRYQLGLARAFNRAQRPTQAITVLDQAIAAGAQGGMALTEKGLALDLLGRFKEAQIAYGQALKLSPGNPETLQRMAFSFALIEEYRTALNLLNEIANMPGGKEQVRNALATVYAMSGQPDQAMKIATIGASKDEDVSSRLPYYTSLPRLDQLSKARAVHLGLMSAEAMQESANSKSLPRNETLVDSGQPYDAPPPPAAPTKPTKAPPPGKPQMVSMPQDATTQDDVPVSADSGSTPAQRATPLGAGDRVWVQLGLSPSRAILEKQWKIMVERAAGGLNGLAPYVQPIMAQGQTQLRLLVGGYADGSTAKSLSLRLKGLKITNYVNRNALPADPLYP
jgi:Flp pilus assembly protein TadD